MFVKKVPWRDESGAPYAAYATSSSPTQLQGRAAEADSLVGAGDKTWKPKAAMLTEADGSGGGGSGSGSPALLLSSGAALGALAALAAVAAANARKGKANPSYARVPEVDARHFA